VSRQYGCSGCSLAATAVATPLLQMPGEAHTAAAAAERALLKLTGCCCLIPHGYTLQASCWGGWHRVGLAAGNVAGLLQGGDPCVGTPPSCGRLLEGGVVGCVADSVAIICCSSLTCGSHGDMCQRCCSKQKHAQLGGHALHIVAPACGARHPIGGVRMRKHC
jgi:hypothetical protein